MREPRRFGLAFTLLLPAFASIVACFDEPVKERICTPDANVFCRCDDRREGVKKCGSDGRSFGECTCSGESKPSSRSPSKDGPERAPADTKKSGDSDEPATTRASTEEPDLPAPTPVTSTPATGSGGSSSGSPAPPPLGPTCRKLDTCCDAMVAAGILADFCQDAVKSGSEDICNLKYNVYRDDPEGMMPAACTM